jgi:hypothetical protein
MSRFILAAIGFGILLTGAPGSAVAQKQSCDAYCAAKVCATANSKNYCMSQCIPKCNQVRSSKK